MVNNPKIRFAGFSDEWVQRKLGDLARVQGGNAWSSSDYVEKGQYLVITISNVTGNEYVNDSSGNYIDCINPGVYELFENDILVSLTGNVGRVSKMTKARAVLNQRVARVLTCDSFDNEFLFQVLSNSEFESRMINVGQGAAQMNISNRDVIDYDIKIPTLKEQQKIGSVFSTLDHKIGLEERQISLLKDLKKGYLQKMFPKQGATEPEIRFKGFTDAWKDRKFKDLLDKTDGVRRGPFGSALKKEYFVPKSNFVVYEQQNAIYDNYETRYKITEEKYNELIKFKVEPGAFIMSGAGTIGRISRVPNDIEPGVFNQALIRFKINNELTDSEYFIQFVRADFMQRKLTGTNAGSAMTNLVPMSEVKKWIIQVPTLSEQQKIGSFFQKLDDTIRHHQRELDLLKDLKKGLSQQMFV